VLARGREIIAEEIVLQHLRKARKLTQENMAKMLGMRQGQRVQNRAPQRHAALNLPQLHRSNGRQIAPRLRIPTIPARDSN
jgi:hypothetical protein